MTKGVWEQSAWVWNCFIFIAWVHLHNFSPIICTHITIILIRREKWNILCSMYQFKGFSWWLSGKEPACKCRSGFKSWVKKIPWRRKWQPTPVFLPGKSHGQRRLVGHSPWGRKRVGHNLVAEQHQGRGLYPVPAHGPRRSGPWFHSPIEDIF